jgi:hypothetical protein
MGVDYRKFPEKAVVLLPCPEAEALQRAVKNPKTDNASNAQP